jgi:hypothetical protein
MPKRSPPILVAALFPLVAAMVPPNDQANLNPGAIALAPKDFPVSRHFDSFKFGEHSSGSVGVDIGHLSGNPPVVVQVTEYGGPDLARSWLGVFLHQHGFRLAYIVPETGAAAHDGQALVASIARGLAALAAKAGKYGFDGKRIVLTSGGIGGDIAALLATDPSYAGEAGLKLGSIRGVVLFDGVGFDLPAYLETISRYERSRAEEAYGKDPALLARISALNHVVSPDAPPFLLEATKGDRRSEGQAEAMAAALRRAGRGEEVALDAEGRQALSVCGLKPTNPKTRSG